jgi:hypothetical protein
LGTGEIAGQEAPTRSDEHPIESQDDYPICARRGFDQETKPKKRPHKIKQADDADE